MSNFDLDLDKLKTYLAAEISGFAGLKTAEKFAGGSPIQPTNACSGEFPRMPLSRV